MKPIHYIFLFTALCIAQLACSEKKPQMVLTFSPEDADVTVDGYRPKSLKSPQTFDFFKPGAYRLEVSKEGYVPVTMKIEVTPDNVLEQTVHLVKDESVAPTPPPVAENDTPNVIAVPAGESDDIAPVGTDNPDTFHLKAGEFLLHVTTDPPGANVWVRTPTYKSVLSMTAPGARVLPGQYPWFVNITMDGYEQVTRTVVAPSDRDEVNLHVVLTRMGATSASVHRPDPPTPHNPPDAVVLAKPVLPRDNNRGLLSVTTTPWTVVTVDGEKVGNTPVHNFPIAPGAHRILLENRDLAKRKVLTIHVRAAEHVRLSEAL
jgi:hypothetical protein